jgi:hypothetical protein
MKLGTLILTAGLIVASNAIALLHVARNRAGEPSAELTLTDRELSYYENPDDSGVELRLHWLDPAQVPPSASFEREVLDQAAWLDEGKLADLGFDVSVPGGSPGAYSFYQRQLARTGFVALEYDGPAWRAWADLRRKIDRARAPSDMKYDVEAETGSASRLVPIDAGPDADALRARHPDRHLVVIVPAVIDISTSSARPATDTLPALPPGVAGRVSDVPSEIHVPQPFSAEFQALPQHYREPGQEEALFRVTLRYGQLLEPWVTAVETSDRGPK